MRNRIPLWLVVSVTLLFVLAFTWAQPGHAAASDGFFAGKHMRILIGFAPGGGHDLEARVLARHLPKHIPGNPSVIVQNMPGAGGVVMTTFLHSRARPNGLTFGLVGRTQILVAILEPVEFNLPGMPVIWGISGTNVDLVRGDLLKVKTFEDLLKVDPDSIVVGGRSRSDTSCVSGQLALQLLGIKEYKAVCAYPGTAPIKAAMERGEVSFFVGTDAHIMAGGAFAEMYERGEAVPVWQSGTITPDGKITRSPTVRDDIPTFYEVYRKVHGKIPSGVVWDALRASTIDLGILLRTYLLPPGTPEDRVTILRQAMVSVSKDPAFVADWEKIFGQKLAPVVVSADRGERLKNDFLKPAPWQDFLRKFVKD